VELANNLLYDEHTDAWSDLATVGQAPAAEGRSRAGERQHVAGQLLAALENSCVLLAGALQQQQATTTTTASSDAAGTRAAEQEDFQRVTEHVYVSIRSFALDLKQPAASQRLQVTFPSQTSVLGARWMSADQRFTLNLQVSNAAETAEQQTGKSSSVVVSGGQGARPGAKLLNSSLPPARTFV
jgi:hypothetical protein